MSIYSHKENFESSDITLFTYNSITSSEHGIIITTLELGIKIRGYLSDTRDNNFKFQSKNNRHFEEESLNKHGPSWVHKMVITRDLKFLN